MRALNEVGALVLSRQVVEHPPPDSELPAQMTRWSSGTDDAYIAALVLIVVMALLEVVLLAGPAFAVGARRQQRTLALMAASGGTPKQARRVILAAGIVLGAAAAALGVVLGLVVGWALLPVVQHFSDSWLGPFDVNPLHLLGIAGFGLLSAFLAAVVPAWLASRQDVVAVLAGRRGDRRPGYRSPLVGLVLLLTRHRPLVPRHPWRRRDPDRRGRRGVRARDDPARPRRRGRAGAVLQEAAAGHPVRRS